VEQFGIKPRNQRETVLGGGTTVKCYSFDNEAQFEQSTLLLKRALAVYGATGNYRLRQPTPEPKSTNQGHVKPRST
jgi:hypothetical protein